MLFHALAPFWEIVKLRDRPWDISHSLMLDDLLLLKNLAWRVKLLVQGHCHWQWEQQMILWMRLGRPSHLWNPSGDLSISGPDSDFPNGVSQEETLQNNCTSDSVDTYMTQEIRVMSDLPEGADFLIAVCDFFWPSLCGHIQLQMQLKSFLCLPDWQIYWLMS